MDETDEIAPRIIAIIARSKAIPPETIHPDSTFEDLQIDSLDKINLTFEVEEAFHIAIPDESLATLRTVQDVINGVARLKSPEPAGPQSSP